MIKFHVLLLIFSLFVITNKTFSQPQENYLEKMPHGTFIITVICNDGILIASDSRAAFTIGKGDSEKVYAYFENHLKIFTIGNFKIAASGAAILNKRSMDDIVKKFNKSHQPDSSLENTFKTFHFFLNTKMDVPDSTIFAECHFFMAGYEKQRPVLLGIINGKYIKETRLGHVINTDTTFRNYFKIPKTIEYTCNVISPILESAILKFAKDKNDYKIGGPIHIIQIKPDNSFYEIKSFKPVKFRTIKKQVGAILNKKLKVEYVYPRSEAMLKSALTEGLKQGVY